MAIISFYSSCRQETGNTVSALAYATFLGLTRNKKTLYISTGLNDNTAVESLWPAEAIGTKSGIFGPNTGKSAQNNSIEELDRIIRSNRTTSDIIADYTRVALKGRLDVLTSYIGDEKTFKQIQNDYKQIAALSGRAYDTVIIDIDQELDEEVQNDILNTSDIILATTTQKLSNIENLAKKIQENEILKKEKTIIVIGKYDDKTRFNTKNISRNLLKQKELINTIPYNSLVLEGVQEGKIIDVIHNLSKLKDTDEHYLFIEELKRLDKTIDSAILKIQMRKQGIK